MRFGASRINETRLPHRFPDCGCTGSHSCIWPESQCYLSMSHTGLATSLTLPLLLCNSTAPSALPPLSSCLEIQTKDWVSGFSRCDLCGWRACISACGRRLSPSLSAVWIDALQALARCALCGARLLNGYKREALHWIHYVGRPIREAPAAVALETGAGWSGPCWWIVNEFVIHKNGEEFPLRIKWVQTNRRTAGRREEGRERGREGE